MPEEHINSSQPPPYLAYGSLQEDEISLKGLFLNLWSYRRAIVLFSMAAILLIVSVAGFVLLTQTRTHMVELEFNLDFEGADKYEYPNGTKFNTSDIVSTPILDRVFSENNLQNYIDFPDFKASLAVIQTNTKLELLEYTYAAKLRESKMSLDERQRLEAEFLEKKKSALVPTYTLLYSREERLTAIPQDKLAKVLTDTLRIWAEYADRVKGAVAYRIPIVSRNILSKEDIDQEDYLVANDIFRLTIDRIMGDLIKLQAIPGSETLRVGENDISLKDIMYRLDDLERFKLSPVLGLVRQTGMTKFPEFTAGYLQNRLYDLEMEETKCTEEARVYETSLERYMQKPTGMLAKSTAEGTQTLPLTEPRSSANVPAMIPQFGASFLDSLVEMAQQNSDALFRQTITEKIIDTGIEKANIESEKKYYSMLYEQIRDRVEIKEKPNNGSFYKLALKRIEETHNSVFKKLMQTIDELDTIYRDLSKHNLNPDSILYTVTQPVLTKNIRAINPKRMLMFVFLALIIAEGFIIFGVLLKAGLNSNDAKHQEKKNPLPSNSSDMK